MGSCPSPRASTLQMEASWLKGHQFFSHIKPLCFHRITNPATSGMNQLEAEIPIAFTAQEIAESLLAAHQD